MSEKFDQSPPPDSGFTLNIASEHSDSLGTSSAEHEVNPAIPTQSEAQALGTTAERGVMIGAEAEKIGEEAMSGAGVEIEISKEESYGALTIKEVLDSKKSIDPDGKGKAYLLRLPDENADASWEDPLDSPDSGVTSEELFIPELRSIYESYGYVFEGDDIYMPGPDRLQQLSSENGLPFKILTFENEGFSQASGRVDGIIPPDDYEAVLKTGKYPIPVDDESSWSIYSHDVSPSHALARSVIDSDLIDEMAESSYALKGPELKHIVPPEDIGDDYEAPTYFPTIERNYTDLHEFQTEQLGTLVAAVAERNSSMEDVRRMVVGSMKQLNGQYSFNPKDWSKSPVVAVPEKGMTARLVESVVSGLRERGVDPKFDAKSILDGLNIKDGFIFS